MLPLLLGWKANTKKPLLGKAEAATHYLNSTDFIALHNTITAWCAKVRCCMIFHIKRLPMLHAQAAQKSNI